MPLKRHLFVDEGRLTPCERKWYAYAVKVQAAEDWAKQQETHALALKAKEE